MKTCAFILLCALFAHCAKEEQTLTPEIVFCGSEIQPPPKDTVAYKTLPDDNSVITIPVVVHVLYNTAQQNISDAQIQAQIATLTQDFRRTNADRSQTLSAFRPIAADCGIQFCLATVTPAGAPTTGITRKYTTTTQYFTAMKYTALGGQDAWNTTEYLNIWVGNIAYYMGYSSFPSSAGQPTDGIVIGYQYFRGGNRVLTHEAGHYLNCYHIWGDDNGACTGTDYCDDTPNAANANYACNLSLRTCGTLNMVQNYMDYTASSCQNLFTAGQRARMRALFIAGGARHTLPTTTGCAATTPAPVLALRYAYTSTYTPSGILVNGSTMASTSYVVFVQGVTAQQQSGWTIELLNSNGTRRFLQTDNELPIDWRNGSPYFLPAGTYRIRVQRNGTTHFDYTIHIR